MAIYTLCRYILSRIYDYYLILLFIRLECYTSCTCIEYNQCYMLRLVVGAQKAPKWWTTYRITYVGCLQQCLRFCIVTKTCNGSIRVSNTPPIDKCNLPVHVKYATVLLTTYFVILKTYTTKLDIIDMVLSIDFK